GVALRLARRGRYQQSITLVCSGNWAAVSLLTFIDPNALPIMLLLALVPVVFAEPYVSSQRGLLFTLITFGSVVAVAALARFHDISRWAAHAPRAIESAFINVSPPVLAVYILVIGWNNAAALRTSEKLLAERAAQLGASRSGLITAADEERRRL